MIVNDGELLVQLNADISGLRSALQDATNMLKNMMGRMEDLEDAVSSSANNIGGSFSAISAEAGNMAGAIERAASSSSMAMEELQGVIGNTSVTMANITTAIRNAGGNATKMGNRQLASLDTLIQQSTAHTRVMGTAMTAMGENMAKVMADGMSNLRGVNSQIKQNHDSTNSWVESFKQFAVQTYIIRSFLEFAGREMWSIVQPGFEFAKQMEVAKLGMSAILMSMGQINGEQIKYYDALGISNHILQDMQHASVMTADRKSVV